MNENPADLAPELCALAAAVAGLVAGMFLPRTRQWPVAVVCSAGLVAGLAFAGVAASGPDLMAFDAFSVDPITHVTRITVLGSTFAVVLLASGPVRDHPRESEHHVLILLSALGTIMLGASSDLLVLVAAYLLASIPAYALAGFGKDAPGTEAALKYYLMGALLGVLMLGGVTLLSGVGRGTAYAVLRTGLADAPRRRSRRASSRSSPGCCSRRAPSRATTGCRTWPRAPRPPSPRTSPPSPRSARSPPSTGSAPRPPRTAGTPSSP